VGIAICVGTDGVDEACNDRHAVRVCWTPGARKQLRRNDLVTIMRWPQRGRLTVQNPRRHERASARSTNRRPRLGQQQRRPATPETSTDAEIATSPVWLAVPTTRGASATDRLRFARAGLATTIGAGHRIERSARRRGASGTNHV
jgi:hypothetical protein